MIQFDLLTKEDYTVLFEGFETSFLQFPLKHPSKTLNRYIPNGFRTDKLKKPQLIKVFTDAIIGNEISIIKYVKHEIETQFSEAGIINYIESHREENGILFGIAIAIISSYLWTHGLREPSYIALLLCGIPCSDEQKAISKELYNAHFGVMEDSKKIVFNEGFSQGEKKLNFELDEEKKKTSKLERTVSNLIKKNESLSDELNKAREVTDLSLSESATLSARLEESLKQIEQFNKEHTQLSNIIKQLEDNYNISVQRISDLQKQLDIIPQREKEIRDLRAELSKAIEMSYSDDVLKRICNEVIDELSAATLTKSELLKIAKKKFSDEETVLVGWEKLSSQSNEIVIKLISNFSDGVFLDSHLDELELLEDGILIRYAICKSLKAILFNALEQAETDSSISSRFGGKK